MGSSQHITGNARSAVQSWIARTFIAASVMTVPTGFALAQTNQSAPAAAPSTAAQPAVQQPQPQTPSPTSPGLTLPPPPDATPPSASTDQQHGFFDKLGRWWHDSVADFNAKLKEQQSKLDDFNKKSAEAMTNAANAMVKMQTSKVIEIREPCAIAGNGAADCATAAVNACKSKGFKDGQPLDVRTAEKCNASLWVSGQPSTPADCPVETVVLRAACQ